MAGPLHLTLSLHPWSYIPEVFLGPTGLSAPSPAFLSKLPVISQLSSVLMVFVSLFLNPFLWMGPPSYSSDFCPCLLVSTKAKHQVSPPCVVLPEFWGHWRLQTTVTFFLPLYHPWEWCLPYPRITSWDALENLQPLHLTPDT